MRKPEQKALAALRAALPGLIAVSAERGDTVLNVPGQGPTVIDLKWAGAGFPRDVQRALHETRDDAPVIVAAERFSAGARQLLDGIGASWVAVDGTANVRLGPIWVDKSTGDATVAEPWDGIRWTDSLTTIAETLLSYAAERQDQEAAIPTVADISTSAHRSTGSVSSALATFDAEGWTQGTNVRRGRTARRRLVAPGAMLDEWGSFEAGTRDLASEYHSLSRDPFEIAALLTSTFESAVISGRVAADRYAPFSTEVGRVRCYLPWGVDRAEAFRRIGLTAAPGVGNVVIVSGEDHVVGQSQVREGMRLASLPRVYVDLLRDGVRGEDAAAHLRQRAIRF